MPQVPRYDSPQVQSAALPNVKVNTEAPLSAFGGGQAVAQAGEATRGLGKQVFDIAQAEKKKADDIAFMDADLEALKAKTDLEIQAKNMQGKDAAGASDYVSKEWQTRASKIKDSLTNDDQRMAVDKALARHYEDLNRTVQVHQNDEFQKYDLSQTLSYVDHSRQEAVENYKDPARIEQSLYNQQAAVTKLLSRKGIEEGSPTAIKMREEVESKTHTEVINRMLADQNDIAAEQYWNKNKDKIHDKEHDSLAKNIEEGSVRGKSQRLADQFVAKTDDMSGAIEKAASIKDPKVREATENRIKDHFAIKKLADKERSEELLKDALQKVDADPRREAVPPDQWNSMTPEEQNTLYTRIDRLRKGEPKITDRGTYYELSQMAANDKQKFLNTNLLVYSEDLDDAAFEKFADMQKEAKKGDPKKLDGFLSDKQTVSNVLTKIGIDPNAKPNTKDGKRAAEFERQLDLLAEDKAQALGRKLTNSELRELAEPLGVEYVTKKRAWFLPDEKKRGFELAPGDEAEDVIVPDADRNEITFELRKAKKPVTDDAIKHYYLKGISRAK